MHTPHVNDPAVATISSAADGPVAGAGVVASDEEGAGEADETDVAAEAEGPFEVELDSRFGLRFEFGFGVAPGAGSEDSSVDIVVANERRAGQRKARVTLLT